MIAEAIGSGLVAGIVWGILETRVPYHWLMAGALTFFGVFMMIDGRLPLIQDSPTELAQFAITFAVFLPTNSLTKRRFSIKENKSE